MTTFYAIMRMYENGETSCVASGYKTKDAAKMDMPRVIKYSLSGYYFITKVYQRKD